MDKRAKVFVAGHRGMVGSAICQYLRKIGHENIVERNRQELDLMDQAAVFNFFETESPQYVFFAAALVGGIWANKTRKADFCYQNLQIQNNIIEASHRYQANKLLFLGSSCIYPRMAPQPIREDYLLTGPLEETNDAYAIAKIAGVVMCRSYHQQYGSNFISVMPTNLYGPGDNFDLETSHVLPAMIHKFHLAKTTSQPKVTLWGTGSPFREFLHVDDLARACVYLMETYDEPELVNIGTGQDITIKNLAELIKEIVGFEGEIYWDTDKPDGTPRKLLDVSRAKSLGWSPEITLEDGIRSTYKYFLETHA